MIVQIRYPIFVKGSGISPAPSFSDFVSPFQTHSCRLMSSPRLEHHGISRPRRGGAGSSIPQPSFSLLHTLRHANNIPSFLFYRKLSALSLPHSPSPLAEALGVPSQRREKRASCPVSFQHTGTSFSWEPGTISQEAERQQLLSLVPSALQIAVPRDCSNATPRFCCDAGQKRCPLACTQPVNYPFVVQTPSMSRK